MPEFMLASAGEDVKLWDGQYCTLSGQIDLPRNISQVCWSPNGQFLASSSQNHSKVLIYYCKKPLTQPLELLPEVPQSYVRFANTSNRFVMTCGRTPVLSIWDLKTRKITKQLNTGLSDGITCAAYNTGDTHIASGGQDGSVVLTNVISSVSLAPMVPSFDDPQGVACMQFSLMHKNLLGTGSDDGSCILWDCNSRSLLHSFTNVHVAPATGIAFSPANELLLATVGLDKRLFYYDVQFKKTVITVKLEHPATCIDFSHDGMHIAVGCYKGWISIYDVRSPHMPVNVFSAHSKDVNAVAFNKLPSAAKDSYFRQNMESQVSLENRINMVEIDNLRQSRSLLDGFSPVRDYKLLEKELSESGQVPHQYASANATSNDDTVAGVRAQAENSSTTNLGSATSSSFTNIAANFLNSPSCLKIGKDLMPSTSSHLAEHSASKFEDAITNTTTNGQVPHIMQSPSEVKSMSSAEVRSHVETSCTSVISERCSSDTGVSATLPYFSSCLQVGTSPRSSVSCELAQPAIGTLPEQWREEMRYEMYKMHTSLHQDIINLQMEMIKNFFKQKNEFEEMLGYRNLAANLMAEVNALKKEVADLKKHY